MIINVTSIRLRSLWKFFRLSYLALHIVKQARTEKGFLNMRNRGFGYDHYTLTAWESEDDLKRFARSGAHLDAMKKSSALATEIRTYSYVSETLPDWPQVRTMLKEKGKIFRYP